MYFVQGVFITTRNNYKNYWSHLAFLILCPLHIPYRSLSSGQFSTLCHCSVGVMSIWDQKLSLNFFETIRHCVLPLIFSRRDKVRQDKTRQSQTRQDKVRQDKVKQDKTRQHRLFLVWSRAHVYCLDYIGQFRDPVQRLHRSHSTACNIYTEPARSQ